MYTFNKSEAQRFEIRLIEGDIYTIKPVLSKGFLTVLSGNMEDAYSYLRESLRSKIPPVNIASKLWEDTDAQKWRIVESGEGYKIVSVLTNESLCAQEIYNKYFKRFEIEKYHPIVSQNEIRNEQDVWIIEDPVPGTYYKNSIKDRVDE